MGGKGGGSITAALFLQDFVEKAKWAHIDMAGPVWCVPLYICILCVHLCACVYIEHLLLIFNHVFLIYILYYYRDNKENKATGYGVKLLVDYLLNAKKA